MSSNPIVSSAPQPTAPQGDRSVGLNPESAVEPVYLGLEEHATIQQNKIVDQALPTVDLIPESNTRIQVPPSDTWNVPAVFKYAVIQDALIVPPLNEVLRIPVNVWACARLDLLAKMWRYARWNAQMKLDFRGYLGTGLRLKVVLVPDADAKPTYNEVLSFPGFEWDPIQDPSIVLQCDWTQAKYVLGVGEYYSQVCIVRLSEAYNHTTTQIPWYVTPTIIPLDMQFSVRTHVREAVDPTPPPDPPAGDLAPFTGLGVAPVQTWVDTPASLGDPTPEVRGFFKWVHQIVGLVGPTLANLVFPSSGEWVLPVRDFIWNLFDLEKVKALRGARAPGVEELREVRISAGTPMMVSNDGGYLAVTVAVDNEKDHTYLLAQGSPDTPELVPYFDPEQNKDKPAVPLNAIPQPFPLGYIMAATRQANVPITTDNISNFTWPSVDSGMYKVITPKGLNEVGDNKLAFDAKFGIYADGQSFTVSFGDAPDGQLCVQATSTGGPTIKKYCLALASYGINSDPLNRSPREIVHLWYDSDKPQYIQYYWAVYNSGNFLIAFPVLPSVPKEGLEQGSTNKVLLNEWYVPISVASGGNYVPWMVYNRGAAYEIENAMVVDAEVMKNYRLGKYSHATALGVPLQAYPTDTVHEYVHVENAPGFVEPTSTPVKSFKSLGSTGAFAASQSIDFNPFGWGEGTYQSAGGSSLPGTTGNVNPDTSNIGAPNYGDQRTPLGRLVTNNTADGIWSPVKTGTTLETSKMIIVPLTPVAMNTTGNPAPSHLQVESLRHLWVQPNAKSELFTLRLSSTTNAHQNGRLLMIHVPYGYSVADINKMTRAQLYQYPRVEHELKGGDTVYSPTWTHPLPMIPANGNPDDDNNGHIVLLWVEYASAVDVTIAQFSLWALPNDCRYTVVIPHRTYKPTYKVHTYNAPPMY